MKTISFEYCQPCASVVDRRSSHQRLAPRRELEGRPLVPFGRLMGDGEVGIHGCCIQKGGALPFPCEGVHVPPRLCPEAFKYRLVEEVFSVWNETSTASMLGRLSRAKRHIHRV